MPIIYGSSEIWGDLLVTGSFSILGSASIINTTNLVVSDTIISLGHSQSGSPILDEGIMFGRGTGLTQAFIWDESDDTFALVETNDDHSVIGDVNINSYSKLRVGGLTTSNLTISLSPNTGYLLTSSDNNGNTQWSPLLIGTTSIDGGADGQIFFQSTGNKLGQDSNIFWNNTSKSLGIGTSSPVASLDVRGNALFNGNSGLFDFTIKGNTASHLFYVDSSSDTVYIGSTSSSILPPGANVSNVVINKRVDLTTVGHFVEVDNGSGGNVAYYSYLKPTGSLLENYSYLAVSDLSNSTISNNYGFYTLYQNGGTGSVNRGFYANINTTSLSNIGLDVNVYGSTYSNTGISIDVPANGTAIFTKQGNVIFNSLQGNSDLTIKGDNDANLFFADASSDYIGIGTSNPLYKLQVSGTVSTTGFRMTNGASNGFVLSSNSDGVGSWTSSTRDLSFGHSSISPVSSTTYHIGFIPQLQPITTNQVSRRCRSAYRGEITSVSIMWNLGSNGTSENVTYQIHNITQATSATITSTAQLTGDAHNTYTLGSPLAVSENDDIQIRWVTPTWITPPGSVIHVITARIRVY